MTEINLEMTKNASAHFPVLTRLELQALIYVIRKLTRGWKLREGVQNER